VWAGVKHKVSIHVHTLEIVARTHAYIATHKTCLIFGRAAADVEKVGGIAAVILSERYVITKFGLHRQ
jgi:hypothetical protein